MPDSLPRRNQGVRRRFMQHLVRITKFKDKERKPAQEKEATATDEKISRWATNEVNNRRRAYEGTVRGNPTGETREKSHH